MKRKRGFTGPVPESTESWMREMGIEVINGTATFTAASTLAVDGRLLGGENIVIATGAVPADLAFDGGDLVATSEAFLDLDDLPSKIVFVGGGYISFEFAWLARRAGAEVAIVHRSKQVLKGFDPGLADKLVSHYESLGIQVIVGEPVLGVEQAGSGLRVVTRSVTIEADLVVHGAGRVAAVGDIGLDAAGVEYSSRGVKVDPHLRSISNPFVWAAGDAAEPGPPLTPTASRQGAIVASNILGGDETFEPGAVPSVVFSDPPMASVGMGASAASRAGVEVITTDMDGWFTQSRLGYDIAGAKVVKTSDTGRLLGAHVLGVNAEEIINLFALAVSAGLTANQMKAILWAYPTATSDIKYLL